MNPAAIDALARGDVENFLVASTPGGIEAQEKAGTDALVQSTRMPLDLRGGKQAFEALGFTFGAPIDDVFQEATMPAGWTRKTTDHSMYIMLLDEKGRERVRIFYKAAFYDRRADAVLMTRYRWDVRYQPDGDQPTHRGSYIVDHGQIPPVVLVACSTPYRGDDLDRAMGAWLEATYPNAKDPAAYWDQA
jgi:hypothetical protein